MRAIWRGAISFGMVTIPVKLYTGTEQKDVRQALEETDRVALARVTIRTRERLATLRSYEDTLSLETMFWPDEIRSTGALDLPQGGDAKVRPKELEMARSLVDSLSDRFKPEEYADEYRSAVEDLIERKMRGEKRNAKRRKPEPKVIDLMDALKASVAESRKTGRRERAKPRKRTSRRTKRAAAA